MKQRFNVIGLAAALAAMFTLFGAEVAVAAFPDRPITIMVGFRAGGGTDSLARLIGKAMEKDFGQTVIVTNKPGGGGAVMATRLKSVKPDGYTIGMAVTLSFAFNPVYSKKTRYQLEDFYFLGTAARGQEAFVSLADKPWKDWKGLIAWAKTKDIVTMSSQSPLNLYAAKIISQREGINIKAVPVKGGAGMVQAVLGKHVDFGFSGGIHASHVKAGKMIVLAATGTQRLKDSPDIPTMMEMGYPVVIEAYFMFAAPKGMPEAVKKTLTDAIAKAVNDKDVKEMINNRLKRPHAYMNPEQLTAYLFELRETYRKALSK